MAGVASTVGFTALHDLFISDIWRTLPIMAVAGALCGLCIAWSYGLLRTRPTVLGWLGYNLAYVVMLGLLGAASVVVFEPTTTLAAVIEANEPPTELILTAMPMTIAFALLAAASISALYGRRWSHHAAIMITVTVLLLLLGLNISAVGLVDIPTDATVLILELFGLTLTLALLYAAAFIALERSVLRQSDSVHTSTPTRTPRSASARSTPRRRRQRFTGGGHRRIVARREGDLMNDDAAALDADTADDELDWDLEERDRYMAEHEDLDEGPEIDVLVRSDE